MTGKEMIRIFKKSGWEIIRIRGSHYTMKKGNLVEQIPYHTKELRKAWRLSFSKSWIREVLDYVKVSRFNS